MKVSRTARALATTLTLAVTAAPAMSEVILPAGSAASFTFTADDGREMSSADLQGSLIVVHFWAASSEPSVERLPMIRDLHAAYAPKGVGFMSVSVDPDPALARQSFADHDMPTLLVLNAEQAPALNARFFAGRYGVPHTFLIGPEGDVLWEGYPSRLESELERALVAHPPPTDAILGDDPTAAADPFAKPAVDVEAIARRASEAVFQQPPNFRGLFNEVKLLPESAFDQAKVKSFGRSVERTLSRLTPEVREGYDLYRTTYPETAAALDRWIAASGRSISDTAAGGEVSPELVASRFQQAEAAEAAGEDLEAYDLYRWIVDRAPNSDEAMLAQDVVLVLEADDDFMARVEAQKLEAQAHNLITMARNYAAAGLKAKANETYQQVVDRFPNTDAAKEAATALGG